MTAGHTRDIVAFIDDLVQRNELGKPFRLFDHQREVLRVAFPFDARGRLPYDTVVWSTPKKEGKTTINAAVQTWWAFTQEPPNELKVVANDLEQAQGRVFKAIGGLLDHNAALRQSVTDRTARSLTLTNGTTIEALASEYAGAAGSNHGMTSWDELWGYTSERSRRLWDELVPVPTRENSVRFVSTYAGFEAESALLRELYLLGVGPEEHPQGQGVRAHPTWPVYANREARLLAYWDHEPRAPWHTAAYRATQRRTLRPGTFLRLFENRWTTGAETFITAELWDGCVDAGYRPPLVPTGRVFVGVDAATKHDTAAVVAVSRAAERIELVAHRIWQPSATEPLDLEVTVERYLRELHARMPVARILADPYQLHRSITTLKAAGLPIEEYAQTTANCTDMGQAVFEALKGRQLRLYADDALRTQALSTVAVESSRGWRIAKEKASRKIDAIVALAMAVTAAVSLRGVPAPPLEIVGGAGLPEAPEGPMPETLEAMLRSIDDEFGADDDPEAAA